MLTVANMPTCGHFLVINSLGHIEMRLRPRVMKKFLSLCYQCEVVFQLSITLVALQKTIDYILHTTPANRNLDLLQVLRGSESHCSTPSSFQIKFSSVSVNKADP